jgi:glycosyltransferase involved in cell wall biosynthesis
MHESQTVKKVLLLDLSGDERSAYEWANRHFPDAQIHPLNKADLKWRSKGEALATIRAARPHTFALYTTNFDLQASQGAMMLFGALAGARRVVFGDSLGRLVDRSQLEVFLVEAPRYALELVCGYLLLVPLTWLFTMMLNLLGTAKKARKIRAKMLPAGTKTGQRKLTALYLRATLASASEGGMATHVRGFAGGAEVLGHRLQFLVCGDPALAQDRAPATYGIKPSATLSATRAIFEMWNNLSFTAQSLAGVMENAERLADIDFIYQRYSRFNWTGAALAAFTRLPLALEFNGSEVWISQRWDPIGQTALLKKIEQVNLHAADFIFTVSDVERRNLISTGIAAQKVFTNPNGVDIEKFQPGSGGVEIRRQLKISEESVVGFLGTFGPWHGAPVLAEAAKQVRAGCHFLFIGDGDERALCEEILAGTEVPATFTGRVTHDRVVAYLDACDILVAPHVPASDGSEFFGSPTKLFEYLAMQKAVVASRLGQIGEVVKDEENGLVVEPGDVVGLAKAIGRLAGDEALRSRLGRAARQTVAENFTWWDNAARVFDEVKKLG